jgi:hypothetical protein
MDRELIDNLVDRINDKIFKIVFQNKESAIEYLETFLSDIAQSLDLEGMTLRDTNLLDEHLGEYFCDAIYETHLKQEEGEEAKRKVRVMLLFEYKMSISSYFDLFLQLLGYIVLLWKKDRAAKQPPTIVIPLVINQGMSPLKSITLHDALKNMPSLKNIPQSLLKFIPQLSFHLLNIQPLPNETILNLKEDGLLLSLFLSAVAVEDKNRIHGVLIEIFKFMAYKPHLSDFFSPIFRFLIREGYFTQEELDEIKNYYHLTPNQEKEMMTTVQTWRQEGRQLGKQEASRITVLRGHFMRFKTNSLAKLSLLPLNEVSLLINGFDTVKKAWKKGKIDALELSKTTSLTKEEIDFVIECLESVAAKA